MLRNGPMDLKISKWLNMQNHEENKWSGWVLWVAVRLKGRPTQPTYLVDIVKIATDSDFSV